MQDTCDKFGDGKTLPMTCCKKGYRPYSSNNGTSGHPMYACPLHDKERRKRVQKEGFRQGEVPLTIFWNNKSNGKNNNEITASPKDNKSKEASTTAHKEKNQKPTPTTSNKVLPTPTTKKGMLEKSNKKPRK